MEEYRRLSDILLKYWEQLRGDRAFPDENQIDPDFLHGVWDHCFLVDATEASTRNGYKYAYLGKDLINAYGDGITEEEAMELVSTDSHKVGDMFAEVEEQKTFVFHESEFTNSKNVRIKYRQILLPLGKTDDQVDFILGGMNWKAH